MINSELNSKELGNSASGMPIYHNQSPVAIKKTVLRDVQNENRSLFRNHQESSTLLERRSIADAIKVCGTKRLTPERPSNPTYYPPLSNNAVNEDLMNVRRRFESELGKRRILYNSDRYSDGPQSRHSSHTLQEIPPKQTQTKETHTSHLPVFTPNNMTSMTTFSTHGPSLHNSLGKPGNGMVGAESDFLKVNSEVPHSVGSRGPDDRQMKERFIHLQKFLKQCDESNQRDYFQMLLNLAPPELSRHAVELEKKAIQLTMEEGKEMQRMKALNILGKSVPLTNPLQTTQQPQSKK